MKEETNFTWNIEIMPSVNKKTCAIISCFNYYDTRINLIRSFLEERGYETTYITSDYNHFEKKHFVANYPNTIQVHVPKYEKNLSYQRLLSQYLFSKKAYKITKELNPDLVYCMFPPNSVVRYIAKYKKERGCKLVFDGYDMWPESFPANKLKTLLSVPFKAWANIRDKYIEHADLILAVSQSMMDVVKDKWKSTSVKLLKPVIMPSELPAYDFDCTNEVSFCYLGNVNHITDIDLLSSILIGVSKRKKVSLHIIGEGQNLPILLSKFDGSDVICHTHGVVMDNDQKKKIYSECNFALNLPREVIHSTMSLKSVEYMSVGLPIINSGEGDNRELVTFYNTGFNVASNTVDQCVNNILNVTPESLSEMHRNTLKAYKDKFLSLDLEGVLSEVLF